MDRRLTYPALGAAALAAAAAGLYLGQSAIDQINPLYFQGAAVHPADRGAAVEETLLARGPRFADHYGWEDGQAARGADCYGCAAVAARDAFASDAQYAVIEQAWQVEPQPVAYYVVEQAPETVAEEQAPPQEPSELERYAGFQIEEKPAEAEPAAVEVASADQ